MILRLYSKNKLEDEHQNHHHYHEHDRVAQVSQVQSWLSGLFLAGNHSIDQAGQPIKEVVKYVVL